MGKSVATLSRGVKTLSPIDQQLLYIHPHIIGNLAGREKLTSMHSEWIHAVWESPEENLLMAHRGAMKTTSICVIGTIWWLLWHPDDRVCIIRKTITDAESVVTSIVRMMELPEIKEIFLLMHRHYPKAVVCQKGRVLYNFKTTITQELSITALGLDSTLTGKHFDKIIGDDCVTLRDRISRAERLRTIEMMYELRANIIDPGKFIGWCGTPWHERDGYHAALTDVILRKYPVSKTGLLSDDEIRQKKVKTTPFLYAANYDLELKADDSLMFRDPRYIPAWDFTVHNAKAHVDAAYDGDHYCALTIMARRPDKKIQAKGFVFSGNIKDWIDFINSECKRLGVVKIFNETNPDKGWTADRLNATGRYSESMNKHSKISTYLYEAWDDILWVDGTDEEYMVQVLDYREGQEPDDAPDSAASLIREAFAEKKTGDHWRW